MALTKGTNSYVTLEEAETYFEGRLDAAAWTSVDDSFKEQALITATSMLDYMNWAGVAVSQSQSLAFPRTGTYFDPRMGAEVLFGDTEAPVRVKEATYEIAHHLLNNDGLLDQSGSATKIEVGRVLLDKLKTAPYIPAHATRLITPMLVNGGATSWWRNN